MPYKEGTKRKTVGFSKEEWEVVCKKAETANMKVGRYLRKAAVQSEVKVFDMREIIYLKQSLRKVATNLNQIAATVNSTGAVYQKDIDDMKEEFDYFSRVLANIIELYLPDKIL